MTTVNDPTIRLQDIMTIKNPIMQMHDIAGEQFVKAVTDIIIATIASEVCDDAITKIVKEALSDEEIMTEVENKIESAIEDLELENKIESAIEDIDWSDKITDALDDVNFSEKINDALGDNNSITAIKKDIHDLKTECNSLREFDTKMLDMVSSLLELIKVLNRA